MEDTDIQDDNKDSGFSLGGYIRNIFLLRAVFGGNDEKEEPAPVIQIDSGSTAIEEEVETKEVPLDEAADKKPAEEVSAS